MNNDTKKSTEDRFIQNMNLIEQIDDLQKQAISSYDEGMTYLAYAKFSNEQINLSLNANAFHITPAFKTIKLPSFQLIDSDRQQYLIIPQFEEKSQYWGTLSEDEYNEENQLFLESLNRENIDVLKLMGLNDNQAIKKVQIEFTKSIENFIKIAQLITELKEQKQNNEIQ